MNKQDSGLWRLQPRRLLMALALSLGLGACGGGVEGQGTGSFGYSQGAITGFGSIVVNGVHFDESGAKVLADDGVTVLQASNLLLGMTVEVRSGAIDQTALTAVASQVQLRSELLGPISAMDTVAGTMTVLGQTVQLSVSTVRPADLSVGQLVEVYAIPDPVTGVYAARRIEPRSAATEYKLRGVVSNVGAGQFTVGSATFAYGGTPALSNGQQVRLLLSTTLDAQGRYVVQTTRDDTPKIEDNTETEIEGVIASYASSASFTVGGLTVDASSATIKPAGSTLAAGLRVEVEGVVVGGVLKAAQLEIKASDDGGSGGSGGGGDDGGAVEYEVDGRITALDTAAKTFVVRGVTISYAGTVSYLGGSEATLALDKKVEVKGVLAADGVTVTASRIKFDT